MATWHLPGNAADPFFASCEAALRGKWAVPTPPMQERALCHAAGVPVHGAGANKAHSSNFCMPQGNLLASPLWAACSSSAACGLGALGWTQVLPRGTPPARAAGAMRPPTGSWLLQLQPLLVDTHLGATQRLESVAWPQPGSQHFVGVATVAPWATWAHSAPSAARTLQLQRCLGAFGLLMSAAVAHRAWGALAAAPAHARRPQASLVARARSGDGAQGQLARGPSSTITNFAAGLVAGIAVDVPLHPIDTIKTRLQARGGFAAACQFRGLWAGLSPVLLRSLPCSSLFFVTYEHTRHSLEMQMGGAQQVPPWWCAAAAGATANVVACSVRVPCEVLKQRMQASGTKQASLLVTASALASRGIGGFYTGFWATVSRELAFAVIQMPLFEKLKRAHPLHDASSASSHAVVGMTCGGVAGSVAGALTTPLDVAKTRIMLAPPRQEPFGVCKVVSDIYRSSGGMRALFRGCAPRTLYVGMSCSLSFGAFECSKSFLVGIGGQK